MAKEKILVVDASGHYALRCARKASPYARRSQGVSTTWMKRSDDHA